MSHSPHSTFAYFFKKETLAPYLFALSKKMQEGHICLDLNQDLPDDETFWEGFEGNFQNPEKLPEQNELIGSNWDEKTLFVLAKKNKRSDGVGVK
jgi:exodeoxyribonuclease V alpha subunit